MNSFESKYDTNKRKGLPPGPICNPGIKAINAAMNPKESDYFYFCHSREGESFYAKTEAGHEQNLREAGLKN